MKMPENSRSLQYVIIGSIFLLIGCSDAREPRPSADTTKPKADTTSAAPAHSYVPVGAQRLIAAYPDQDLRYEDNSILFPNGRRIAYDDGREKDFIEKLDDCDIEDMFNMTYDKKASEPAYLNDCGRGRCEAFFKAMYGDSEAAVRQHLVSVDWFGQKIPFTSVNGAAAHLANVAKEFQEHPELHKYLSNASSFYWRKVRGANRQSAHSYGIAIDINTSYSNYWLWANRGVNETDSIRYENRIPLEIVQVFERNGFIWGGRWYHYDTMHFEYRPEINRADKN